MSIDELRESPEGSPFASPSRPSSTLENGATGVKMGLASRAFAWRSRLLGWNNGRFING